MKVLWNLYSLELIRQWRQPRSWMTLILFVLSSMMVLYFGFNRMIKETWVILFWILLLFGGITAAVGEDQLSGKSERYIYYQWASAHQVYLSKLLYQAMFLFVISLLQYTTMSLFFGNYLPWSFQTAGLIIVGAVSLSIIFCFVSAIVSAAERGTALATLLAFPLVIPTIMLLIRMTYSAIGLVEPEFYLADFYTLIGLDALLLGLGLFLYPLIWKS